MEATMPFHIDVTQFALGERRASLLRIHPVEHWLGLVRFDSQQKLEWVNAAYLAALGWRPVR
jgi:hypothetical protein